MRTNKRRFAGIAAVIASLMASPAMANSLNTQQAQFAFDSSQGPAPTEQVAALSNSEMKQTKGEYGLYGAAAGATIGTAGYLGTALSSGTDFSWSGLGSAATAGAVAGALGPAATTIGGTAASSGASFVGGYAAGSLW